MQSFFKERNCEIAVCVGKKGNKILNLADLLIKRPNEVEKLIRLDPRLHLEYDDYSVFPDACFITVFESFG